MQLNFDPSSAESVSAVRQELKRFDTPVSGRNEYGDPITASATDDCLVVRTTQKNGWIRTNYYYSDGTIEELFDPPV